MRAINKHSANTKIKCVEMPNAPYLDRWQPCKPDAHLSTFRFCLPRSENLKSEKSLNFCRLTKKEQ